MKQVRSQAVAFLGIFLLTLALLPGFFRNSQESSSKILGAVPVQSGGRVKPFESFAREALLSVTGKESLEGRTATTVVWEWIANPEEWNSKSFLPAKDKALKKELGLRVIQDRISPELVLKNESPAPLEKKRTELYDKVRLFEAIAEGSMPGFIPHGEDPRRGWLPLISLWQDEARKTLERQYSPQELHEVESALSELVAAFRNKKLDRNLPARKFLFSLEHLFDSHGISLDQGKIKAELFYHSFRPFRGAWIFYFISGILWVFLGKRFSQVPLGFFFTAFLLHTSGFFFRCLIAGRPPVTNMYESIIWVAWAVVFFSILVSLVYRNWILWASAAWVSSLALGAGESFPAVLDPSLSPLVPVLRNNYWLTVHVLTITLSYGAFALAWGLAHANLVSFAFRPEEKEEQDRLANYLYRALQIGVVLLASGTILGGIWANDSWGRFWGWDPKETWALITLLGYLALLHGRFAGRLGSFGTALGSVLAFLGVLMAWYGVNFVLARGFHSYGFGAGGLPYVLAAVLIDLLFVSFLAFRYNKNKIPSILS